MTKHSDMKWDQEPELNIVPQLENIEVKIFEAPTIEQLRRMISVFMMNTWNDELQYEFNGKDVDACIKELFAGNILPTGMELPQICWSVSGLDMIDTTHLIRHRAFSFSAQVCSDRDNRHDNIMLKPGIEANPVFFERYVKICHMAKQLYADMIDSELVNCLDARTILPRALSHFYLVRSNIKDTIAYCNMRKDEQIQTQVDNIVAMKLWLEILKRYPFLKGLVDFNEPDRYYVKQCAQGKSNIFPPNAKNNVFESDAEFVHSTHRDDFPGGDVYKEMRKELLQQMEEVQ